MNDFLNILRFKSYIFKNKVIEFLKYPFIKLNHLKNLFYRGNDEFHKSLSMDSEYMLYLTEEQRKKYLGDLIKSRNIAHEKDL